jgi:hypothetical protein
MAIGRMYGKWTADHQNSKGWTKRAKRRDEESQIAKDLQAEGADDDG